MAFSDQIANIRIQKRTLLLFGQAKSQRKKNNERLKLEFDLLYY